MESGEHQNEAERYLAKAKAWMPDSHQGGSIEFNKKAMMCDLNTRIAQVHAALARRD